MCTDASAATAVATAAGVVARMAAAKPRSRLRSASAALCRSQRTYEKNLPPHPRRRHPDPAPAPRPQITKDELAKALTSLEMDASEEAVMQMMQRIDKDSSGTITLDEFSSIVAWQLQLLANGLGSRKSLVAES